MAALTVFIIQSTISGVLACGLIPVLPLNHNVVVDYGGCNCGNDRSGSETCDTTDSIDISFLENATLADIESFLQTSTNLGQSEIDDLLGDATPTQIVSELVSYTDLTVSEANIIASIVIDLRYNRRSNIEQPIWSLGPTTKTRIHIFSEPRVAPNTYRLIERLPRPLAGAAATMGPPSSTCEARRGTVCGGGVYVSASRGFKEVTDKCWEWEPVQKRWIEVGRMPVPRAGPGWTLKQETGELIITGGIVEGTTLTDKMFTTRNGRQFQEIGRLPSPRSGHCVVPLKEKKVFVGGGVGQAGEILEDALIFDPKQTPEENWTRLPDIPSQDVLSECAISELCQKFTLLNWYERAHEYYEGTYKRCCFLHGQKCCPHFGPGCCDMYNYGIPSRRDLNRDASGRKEFSCGRTVNPRNNHEEVIVTGGRSESYKTSLTTQILDTVTRTWRAGPTIPVDVVGRTTIHDGEDFLLVGASDNGDTAPMVRWDSRNSRWIELETKSKKAFGAPVLVNGKCHPQGFDKICEICCRIIWPRPELCERVDCSRCTVKG